GGACRAAPVGGGGGEPGAIDWRHRLVAHDRDLGRRQQGSAERAGLVDQAGADRDVVAAAGQLDPDGARGHAGVFSVCRWERNASITCSVVRSAGCAVESTMMSASAYIG